MGYASDRYVKTNKHKASSLLYDFYTNQIIKDSMELSAKGIGLKNYKLIDINCDHQCLIGILKNVHGYDACIVNNELSVSWR